MLYPAVILSAPRQRSADDGQKGIQGRRLRMTGIAEAPARDLAALAYTDFPSI